jgi:hypothetical protein
MSGRRRTGVPRTPYHRELSRRTAFKVKWAIRLLKHRKSARIDLDAIAAATGEIFPGMRVAPKSIMGNDVAAAMYAMVRTTEPHVARPRSGSWPSWLRRMTAPELRDKVVSLRAAVSAAIAERDVAIAAGIEDAMELDAIKGRIARREREAAKPTAAVATASRGGRGR